MATDDGGPFHFVPEIPGVTERWEGASLRDYFAGQALVGLFAGSANPNNPGISASDYEAAAWECYRLADAMIAARSAKVLNPDSSVEDGNETQ